MHNRFSVFAYLCVCLLHVCVRQRTDSALYYWSCVGANVTSSCRAANSLFDLAGWWGSASRDIALHQTWIQFKEQGCLKFTNKILHECKTPVYIQTDDFKITKIIVFWYYLFVLQNIVANIISPCVVFNVCWALFTNSAQLPRAYTTPLRPRTEVL